MAGIVGIARKGEQALVEKMLAKIAHRGKAGSRIVESRRATMGIVWTPPEADSVLAAAQLGMVWDGGRLPLPGAIEQERRQVALAVPSPYKLFLVRGPLGVRPLYYGRTENGTLCFASEVKALLEVTRDVHEMPPGTWRAQQSSQEFFRLTTLDPLRQDADTIADALRSKLEKAVQSRVDSDVMGCWLSGGLDSSAIAALARPHVSRLHTFAAGLSGAPDLDYARQAASFLGTEHHEVILTLPDLVAVLPTVIYHLESFDALLVRSSVAHYLAAQRAADYVGSVFSGEGGDELFAGYEYLKELPPEQLPAELLDIIGRLHNTALQRVDRSASAHGLIAHVPFLDTNVVEYALCIPPEFKLRRNGELTEKWIVRRALQGRLPDAILWRPKSKFWQGAGVGELLAQYASNIVSHEAFACERTLPNGWVLNTREELLYYRIFREYFGELNNLDWMGRTQGAPGDEMGHSRSL